MITELQFSVDGARYRARVRAAPANGSAASWFVSVNDGDEVRAFEVNELFDRDVAMLRQRLAAAAHRWDHDLGVSPHP